MALEGELDGGLQETKLIAGIVALAFKDVAVDFFFLQKLPQAVGELQFAARAQKSIRSNSDWIARYGGEEFLIVLPETSHADGLIVAEKIRNLVAALPFTTRAGDAPVTASFGVASTGPNGPDLTLKVETLIRTADECLYRSKLAGRNCSSGQEIEAALALMARA